MIEHVALFGLAAGTVAGCSARLRYGSAATPHAFVRTAGVMAGGWWGITYPLGSPDGGTLWIWGSMGYLVGNAIGIIVETIRRSGWGDGGSDGGGGGGGGGGWDPPEDPEPWGPGPTDFEPERSGILNEVPSSLTMDDFLRETEAAPAPIPAEHVTTSVRGR